jgi:hypothetical protein
VGSARRASLNAGGDLVGLLRRAWGLGIASVMIVAVAPYPMMGLFVEDEIPHRIHNTVGALQYLPLWAIPVLAFTFGRNRLGSWRIALASSVAMAGVGLWSGDLVASLSWMPLATLIVLWPGKHSWIPDRPNWRTLGSCVAAAVVTWVAVAHSPQLIRLQQLGMGDSHSLRFHFSGMAAAYVALSLSCVVTSLYGVGRFPRSLVGGSTVVAGVCSLAWPNYESALGRLSAVALVGAGLLISVIKDSRPMIER